MQLLLNLPSLNKLLIDSEFCLIEIVQAIKKKNPLCEIGFNGEEIE